MLDKRIIIVCGHYGSGKTNLSLNFADYFAKLGEKVTLIDLDIVNPYFRSSDYGNMLSCMGVHLIKPNFAGTTLDVPSLSAEILSVFNSNSCKVIIDAGGDAQGATALGRYSKNFSLRDDYEMLFVANKYRPMAKDEPCALEILREIEDASKLRVTGVWNNSHLMQQTTADDILSSLEYSENIAEYCKIKVLGTSVPENLYSLLCDKVKNPFLVKKFVGTPW